jgi:hypothetical protein
VWASKSTEGSNPSLSVRCRESPVLPGFLLCDSHLLVRLRNVLKRQETPRSVAEEAIAQEAVLSTRGRGQSASPWLASGRSREHTSAQAGQLSSNYAVSTDWLDKLAMDHVRYCSGKLYPQTELRKGPKKHAPRERKQGPSETLGATRRYAEGACPWEPQAPTSAEHLFARRSSAA